MASFASSYIPTQASQVTRAADQVSILTSAFAWADARMTAVMEFTPKYADNGVASEFVSWYFSSSPTNYLQSSLSTTSTRTGQPTFSTRNSGTIDLVVGGVGDLTPPGGVTQKWAMSFDATVLRAARNGGTVGTEDTAIAAIPTPTTLHIGAFSAGVGSINGHIKRFTHFASLKSQADLNALTVL